MFQKTINKLLSMKLYDTDFQKKYVHRFISHNSIDNKFNQYANGKIKFSDIKSIVQAISFNSTRDWDTWNVKPMSLYMFNKGKPVISEKLCKKIIKNISPEFHKGIEEYMYDYCILFDDEGNQIEYKDYPLIYIAMGYIYAFPITFFTSDFTTSEMNELTKFLKGQVFIIFLSNKIKLYRNINKGKYESIEFDKSIEGLISMVMYFNKKPENKIESWITTLTTPENINKIKAVLF